MNDHDEHPILIAVATTIADGMPVDWESLMAEHPEIAKDLEELRVLQGVEAGVRKGAGEAERRVGE
jgi:hypothetical protein